MVSTAFFKAIVNAILLQPNYLNSNYRSILIINFMNKNIINVREKEKVLYH